MAGNEVATAHTHERADETDVDGTAEPGEDDLVDDDLMIEDIAIDGMCGVY